MSSVAAQRSINKTPKSGKESYVEVIRKRCISIGEIPHTAVGGHS